MTHEQPRFIGQRQNFHDTVIKLARVTAWEITTRRSTIRHEQRIPREGRITHDMHHAGGRMARRIHGEGLHRADHIGVAIFKQRIKL